MKQGSSSVTGDGPIPCIRKSRIKAKYNHMAVSRSGIRSEVLQLSGKFDALDFAVLPLESYVLAIIEKSDATGVPY